MKKFISCILIAAALFLKNAGTVYAQNYEVSSSASIKRPIGNFEFDYRIASLEKFLAKFNSPLTPFASDFVQMADFYGIDYRLVPSISGVESTFGKFIPFESYNAYGWANGNYKFKSWPDSIEIVTRTLRTKYFDKGANNISQIARRYAPPSSTWGGKVKYFEGKIAPMPLSFDI